MLATTFNGTSNKVSFTDNAALNLARATGFTLSVFGRLSDTTGTGLKCIFGWGTYGAANSLFLFYAEDTHPTTALRNKLYLYGKTANGVLFECTSVSTIAAGGWHQLGVWVPVGGASIGLLVDGVLEGAATFTSNDDIDAGASWYIGCRGGTANYWKGDLCLAAKWDRPLAISTELPALAAGNHPCWYPTDLAWCLEMGDNLNEIVVPLTVDITSSGGTIAGPTITLPSENPLYTALISSWPLDDLLDSTSWAWDHITRNNADVSGTCATTDDYCLFDGSSYLTFGSQPCPSLYAGDVFKFSADVYLDSIAADATVLGCWSSGGNEKSRVLYFDSGTGKFIAKVSTDGSAEVSVSPNVAIAAETWYRVQFWCDGTYMGARVDDTEAQTAFSSTIYYPPDELFYFGHSVDYGDLAGRMKNVCFWSGTPSVPRYWRNIIAAGWSPTLDEPTDIDLVLLCGQSNCLGAALSSALVNPTADSYRRRVPWYLGVRPNSKVDTLYTGWAPTYVGGIPGTTLGLETGLAETLGDGWGILRYAVGSSGVAPSRDEWYPGDTVHTELLSQVAAALAQLTAVGITGHLRAMVWCLGETDGINSSHAAAFSENFAVLIADLRTRYGDLPVVMVRHPASQAITYISTIIAQEDLCASAIDDLVLVDPADYVQYEADGVHFDAYTQLRLGREIGQAVLDHAVTAALESIAGYLAGFGARTVTITVTDGTDPLEGAKVRLTKGAESYVLATNASGQATFALNDGTWAVTITLPIYTFTATTLLVDGNETETYDMTAVSIPASDVDRVTGYLYVEDNEGTVQEGVEVVLTAYLLPGTGLAVDAEPRTSTSAADGLVSFENLIPGAMYKLTDANGDRLIAIPSDATSPYALPSVVL